MSVGLLTPINQFCMTVNLLGSPNHPYQAQMFQIVAPWGQTDYAHIWEGAVEQVLHIGSKTSGRMGMYWQQGLTNGLVTASLTAPTSANPIRNG